MYCEGAQKQDIMKTKNIIAIAIIAILSSIFAAPVNGQQVYILSPAKYKALSDSLKASSRGRAKTRALNPDNGRRALHLAGGVSYNALTKSPEANLSLGYQLGKNGGFEFGAQAASDFNRFTAEVYAKQNLGIYTAESVLIPALRMGVGACDQDMYFGKQTEGSSWIAVAAPRMAFCASAEFDLKWKPSKKEPRLYLEGFCGYRITPSWGKAMKTGEVHADGNLQNIASPLEKKFGYFYAGVRIGWALYRVK